MRLASHAMTTAASRERPCPVDVPESLPALVRPLRRDAERETNYVRSSWTRAALAHRPAKVWCDAMGKPVRVERMDERTFFDAHLRRLVPRLFARSTIVVAEPKNTPGMLAGWLAFEPARRVVEPGFARPEADRPLVVHFLYVTHDLRRMGVAALLARSLPAGPVTYSHWSPALEHLAGPRGWAYDETRKWD